MSGDLSTFARSGAIGLSLLFHAGVASGHDTWLLPAQFHVEPGATLKLELTSAMAFPKPETAAKADRLLAAKVRIGGETLALEPEAGPQALVLSARVTKPGLAVAWAASRERTLDLSPKEVAHYLEEIGAADTIGKEWKKSGGKTWRETYAKRAKTFVRVGPGPGDDSWRDPVGLDLELVPESNPTSLAAGDSVSVRLLWQGKPLAGIAVGAVGASPAEPVLAKTDDEGRVAFSLSKPGPWLIRTTWIRASQARPGEWESVFTTLTLEAHAR